MTTPGIFNLLITDDTEQDSYLIAQGKLSERLKTIKNSKLIEYNNAIDFLLERINVLKSTIIQTIDDKTIKSLQLQLFDLQNKLTTYSEYKNDLIKPNVNDINKTHFLFINSNLISFSFLLLKN